jgi:outer membrane immunogenic protein
MKRLAFAVTALSIVGGSALAADLPPPYAPPPRAPAAYIPVAPPFSWTGFYIGANLGAGWNSGGSISDTFGSTFTGSGQTTKFTGGGQVGVNYEFWGGVVIGAEATFNWLTNTTNTISVTEGTLGGAPAPGTVASATLNSRWLTTATGKLGYAWNTVLLYGKAGGAWVGSENPNLTVGGIPTTLTSSTTNNSGWTAGVGIEWAFAGNWSARAEYDFVGLQNRSITVAGAGPFAGDTINFNNRNISLLTAGVNYRFGWGY